MTGAERVVAGKYRIVELLRETERMVSYRAEHLGIQRIVELRTLSAAFAKDAEVASLLFREARIAGSVPHRNLQSIVDSGEDENGTPFLVYEHIQGESLADRLALNTEGVSVEEAMPLMLGVLDALSAMHRAGVVHRKLTLASVFITQVRGGGEMVKIQRRGDSAFMAEGESLLDPHDDIKQAVAIFRALLTGTETGSVESAELDATLRRALHSEPRRGFADAEAFRAALVRLAPRDSIPHALPEEEPQRRMAGDSLIEDLRRMQKRQSLIAGLPTEPRGAARIDLMTTLLSIEAIYRKLGADRWSMLVDQVPEVEGLLPASGRVDENTELGVPVDLAGRIFAAADRIAGAGDLSLLPELGEAMAVRGLRRIHPRLAAGATPGQLIEEFPKLWALMTRQGEARVLDRIAGSARLTIAAQVEPSLELCALMAGFLRGALHVTGAGRVAVQSGGCQALGDAMCVFGVVWDPPT